MKYLALLRGINVGGKSLIKMADLKEAMTVAGFENITTYIQSGNVMFESDKTDNRQLGKTLAQTIDNSFALHVDCVVFSRKQWLDIVKAAPKWWGKDESWKHNLLVMTSEQNMTQVLEEIGELKIGIEKVEAGNGVLYQSISWNDFSKAKSGRIASLPLYKQMTIRNYNTTVKLAKLLS